MPKQYLYDQKEVQGSNYIHPYIEPAKPVVDKTFEGLAKVAKQGVVDYQSHKLSTDLQDLSDAYVDGEITKQATAIENTVSKGDTNDFYEDAQAASAQATITAEEARHVQTAQNQVDKLRNAHLQGRITGDALKAKAEALMKGYIAQTPGLSKELRKVASSVLGFDPTGSALKNAMTAEAANTAQGLKQLNHQASILETLGFANVGDDRYETVARYWPDYQQMQMEKVFRDNGIAQIESIQKMNSFQQNRQARRTLPLDQLETVTTVKAVLGLNSITPSNLDAIPADERINLMAALDNEKFMHQSKLYETYTELTPDAIDKLHAGSLNYFDQTKAWLAGDVSSNAYAAMYKGKIERAKNKIAENDFNAGMIALFDTIGNGQSIPPAAALTRDRWMAEAVRNIAMGADGDINAGILASVRNSDGTVEEAEEVMHVWERNLADGFDRNYDDLSKDQKKTLHDTLRGYLYSVKGRPKSIRSKTVDNLFRIASSDNFVKFRQDVKSPQLKEELTLAAQEYLPRVFGQLQKDIKTDLKGSENYELVITAGGSIKFKAKPLRSDIVGRVDTSPKRDLSLVEQRVKRLNATYTDRFNQVIKGMAHLDGHKDYETTAINLLGMNFMQPTIATFLSDELKEKFSPSEDKE
jgi:hypothetical protein